MPEIQTAKIGETAVAPQAANMGMSLSQDAWRRLRKNRVAMLSMGTLIAICVLAFLTPLLPLQAPDHAQTELQYEEPTATPLWVANRPLDTDEIARTPELVEKMEKELAALKKRYEQAQTSQDELANVRKELRRKEAEIQDTIHAPFRKLGYPPMGLLSRSMVRARFALFGNWSVNSLCGRDLLGRDLLSRLFWGARISLIVGLVATIVSLVIGVNYGAISGYCGGWIDDAMMRFVDVLYSVPFIFVVIFLLTILGEESIADELAYWGINRITVFFLVVGAIYWLTMSRVVRGQVISLKHELFVESARSLGASQSRIVFLHLLPNLMSVVLVYLTLTIPRVMLFEAFLSFLGLGVEPPEVSWGLLANEGIKVISPVKIYWWLILFPSLALGTTLLALNFLGDGVRDALDPRLRDA
ncbi:ABC transporter permease [Bythopirellula polymerisocia]|uniref:Oligopeptide transport system permease protein OppC n=1 Tax=Bythopirellula polymerisocia TaxID=2528003 RepID=A0A5C6CUQ2_9BACT|nr:ABC transporter permease [Bythopirellula polymerisocia]TWU28300.1 Dipeptide transport system permease protein DppC [Bythopirellula polymerisocia]